MDKLQSLQYILHRNKVGDLIKGNVKTFAMAEIHVFFRLVNLSNTVSNVIFQCKNRKLWYCNYGTVFVFYFESLLRMCFQAKRMKIDSTKYL